MAISSLRSASAYLVTMPRHLQDRCHHGTFCFTEEGPAPLPTLLLFDPGLGPALAEFFYVVTVMPERHNLWRRHGVGVMWNW